MIIESTLPKAAYLRALKDRMESHFTFGLERPTGFFLGPLIYVTYHSGWEWNRRITNQKNTAVGFVKTAEGGTEVHCIFLKGPLAPHLFIPLFCAVFVLCLSYTDPTVNWTPDVLIPCVPISFLLTLVCAGLSGYLESLTEKSEEGAGILRSILANPSDPFSN